MTTHDTHEDAWAWPCPYCGTQNLIESAICVGCRAQLRDPEEDDLFTTVATENAQVVDPDAPRIREFLWSTEVPPDELVAEELPHPAEPTHDTGVPTATGAQGQGASPPFAGPFSQAAGVSRDPGGPESFASAAPQAGTEVPPPSPFGPSRGAAPPGPASGEGLGDRAPAAGTPAGAAPTGFATGRVEEANAPGAGPLGPSQVGHGHVTPDENGLSVAVDHLGAAERERCAVPIGVCGALLGDQEVVLGLLAGHLMGHAAVLMLTNTRVLVANARRWKPLLDQFLPSADMAVHLRHDRDVASLTIVQGPRLTTLDGVSDVAGAMELAERIRTLASRAQ